MSSRKYSKREFLALAAKSAAGLSIADSALAMPFGFYQRPGNYWLVGSSTGEPSVREATTAVWSGSEAIFWGGVNNITPYNTGSRYNPVTNTWSATTTTGAPQARSYHAAVWSGSEMIVWGGSTISSALSNGGRYNPITNSWTATPVGAGCPSARVPGTAVWTGTEMIIWGGSSYNFSTYYNTGARYNPSTNAWTTMSTTGAPSARDSHSAIWTGTEFIVWGGWNGSASLGNGARYNPATNSWTAMSTTGAPSARDMHSTVWTGTKMIVWGGFGGLVNGGIYDPTTNSWTSMSSSGAPSGRNLQEAIWTGSKMIIWSGVSTDWSTVYNTGGVYDLASNTWTSMSTASAPSPRHGAGVAWTGREMITFGGYNESSWLGGTGRYRPR